MAQTTDQRCATCAEPLHPGDQFCGNCGAPVAAVGESGSGARPSSKPTSKLRARRRSGRWVVAGLAAFIAVGAISGLVVAFIDARRDVDDERDKVVAAQTIIVGLTDELESTVDPDEGLEGQLAAARADLSETQSQLAGTQSLLVAAQTELTAEQDARAADVAAAEVRNTEAVAAVQAQLDAVQAQLTALQAAFPLDEESFRAAVMTRNYAVTIQPLECTIVECLQLTTLSLSFPDPTKVSGTRANGLLAFQDGSYVSSGTLSALQSPLCVGVETTATFELVFHASRVAYADGLLTATEAVGTYRETIAGGDCTDQFRSYSVTMVEQ